MHIFSSTPDNRFWPGLYDYVLTHGEKEAPRGRKTIAVHDITYRASASENWDYTPARKLNPTYVFRELLWFINASRFDTRIAEYAPIWKACIDESGGINSNYGSYLFNPYGGYDAPFFYALQRLADDHDTRRCWIPIFQSWHQTPDAHNDYPCTTGIGFTISGDSLDMKVHMRSQDLVHGAGNDNAICHLFQHLAIAYLRRLTDHEYYPGYITHHIDNLHIYERHWDQAQSSASCGFFQRRNDILELSMLVNDCGFSEDDLNILFNESITDEPSLLLDRIWSIDGAYGVHDDQMRWYRG